MESEEEKKGRIGVGAFRREKARNTEETNKKRNRRNGCRAEDEGRSAGRTQEAPKGEKKVSRKEATRAEGEEGGGGRG